MRVYDQRGAIDMVKKRVAIIFWIVLAVALTGYSPSSAATATSANLPPLVFLNDSPSPMVVTRPGPISLPAFFLGGQWSNKPFELYAFTGDTAGLYLGSDFLWHPYTGLQTIKPVIATGYAGYQFLLPPFANLFWTAFQDTSQFPDGDIKLTICIDDIIDGALQTTSTDSSCGSTDIVIQSPACIMSLSNTTIQQTITQGGNAQTQTITVSDTCKSTSFTASVVGGGNWLSVPQSFSGSLNVSFNASGLPAGSYTASILVTSAEGVTGNIAVSLTVTPKQACSTLTPTPASFGFTGTVTPVFNTVTVNNSPQALMIKDCSGNIPANLTVAVTSGNTWLSMTPNADGSFNVSASGKAGTGTHSGTITASAPGFTSLTVPVTISAQASTTTCNASTINLWPSSLSFSGIISGSVSSAINVTVKDGCTNDKNFSASANRNWISISPTSGTGSFNVTVTMPAVADTSGSITVNVGGVPYTLPVSAFPSGPACTLPDIPLITDPGTTVASGAAYTVTWSAANGATGYNICEASNSGFVGQTCTYTTATSANYNHTNNLCGAATYYYRVNAVNTCGTTNYSTGAADMQVQGTNIASQLQLKDTSGNVLSSMTKSMTAGSTYSQTINIVNDCGTSVALSGVSVNDAATCTTPFSGNWITAQTAGSSSFSLSINTTGLTAGTYTACVKPTVTGTNLQAPSLLVNISVSTPLPANIIQLTSGQITPITSIPPQSSQVYSAMQTGSIANYTSATKDWATECDMVIMYSGATCGQKLPDINDYNDIIADIKATGNYYAQTGKIFNGYTFYYQIMGQTQSVSLSALPAGCYYVYVYNTSSIDGSYVLTWTQR